MRRALIAGLVVSLMAPAAMAAPKPPKAATAPVIAAEAEKNKAQLLAEKRQHDWDRKAAASMKSICSNC